MAAGESSDILMKFVLDGKAILGTSMTNLDARDRHTKRSTLLNGFHRDEMFEIDSFSFSVGVEDNEGGGNGGGGKGGSPGGAHGAAGAGTAAHGGGHAGGAHGGGGRKPLGGFQAWRTGKAHKKYPLSVQPITFTRGIDKTSRELLHYCIKCTSFDSVSLVKRKSAGSASAGEPYLRMDFVGVLIENVAWSNDDPVKETVKFISRSITVRYKPQLPDGTLGAARVGFWSMLPWETEAPLK